VNTIAIKSNCKITVELVNPKRKTAKKHKKAHKTHRVVKAAKKAKCNKRYRVKAHMGKLPNGKRIRIPLKFNKCPKKHKKAHKKGRK
jgi:hypothetical protein